MKRISKKLLLGAVLLLIAINVNAQEQKLINFYSGKIIGSQYSKIKPEIKNLEYYESIVNAESKIKRKSIKNTDKSELAYLAVSIKLEPGRSLSTHDYIVIADKMAFACMAIQVGAMPFDATDRIIDFENPNKIYTLLFAMDSFFKSYKFTILFRHAFDFKGQEQIVFKPKTLGYTPLANLSGEKPPVAEIAKPEPKPEPVAEIAKPETKPTPVAEVAKPVLLDINKATSAELQKIGATSFIAGQIVSRRAKGEYSNMQNLLDRFNDAASCQPALKELDGKIVFNATVTVSTSTSSVSDGKMNINNYPTREDAKSFKIPYYLIGYFIRYIKKENKKFSNFDEFLKAKEVYYINQKTEYAKTNNKDEKWLNSKLKLIKNDNKKLEKYKDKFSF